MPQRILLSLIALLIPISGQALELPSLGGGSDLPDGEYIIVSGGPASREWEVLRTERAQHDRWWGNFVRAARLRMEQIRKEKGADAQITWLVFKPAYVHRSKEDGVDRIPQVISVRDKETVNCKLIWFDETSQLIRYLNQGGHGVDRSRTKIAGFDYFGHSNKYCFTFDYSGEISGASKVFLHVDDLPQINRGLFVRGAKVQSWGCHTGEAFSQAWRRSTGVKMRGAIGKTDYSECWRQTMPVISTPGGRWTY
tara:strand:+ start:30623 stop:31381 length:759 start_codon:yes stop_codon:yes gene_type:complete